MNLIKEQIVPVLETLQRLFNQGDKYTEIAADTNHPAHELLNLVGGYVFREVNMAPITAVYSTMRSDLSDAIADSIISRVGEGKVSRQAIVEKGGIGEYFTRLKNEPDFAAVAESKKGKIVEKLRSIGLTPEVFAEVLVDADESWKEDILDSIQDYDGAVYKEAIEEAVDEYFVNPKKLQAPYMTIGFESKPKARRDLKAALYQADLTGRPQIVTQDGNTSFYDIISEFGKISGVKGLLNTSFNIHGKPIVQTASEAYEVYKRTSLDALVFDGFLIERDR